MTKKTFAIPIEAKDAPEIEQEVKDFVRQWVGLLAERKFEEALAQLSPEVPSGSGSVDARQSMQWTPSLLEAVITNYGTPEPWDGGPQAYAVVPLDDALSVAFEERVSVSFYRAPMSRNAWLGAVEFDLPLNYLRGNAVGDLSARLLFKPLGPAEMVLVLLDIHVL
jgi:hypothetical protein